MYIVFDVENLIMDSKCLNGDFFPAKSFKPYTS